MKGDLGSIEAVKKRIEEIKKSLTKKNIHQQTMDLIDELAVRNEELQFLTETGWYSKEDAINEQ